MQNTDPTDGNHQSLLQKLVSEANDTLPLPPQRKEEENALDFGQVPNGVTAKQIPDLPETFPGPIIGCKCTTCKGFFRSAALGGQQSDFAELGIFQMPKMSNSLKRFK